MIGTETWLDPNIKDSEIFPSGYRLHRKDRITTSGGGVLIAVKNEYNSEDVPELDTDCEIIWTKLHLVGNSTIYLCSYYRHHVSDEESINQFEISVMRASSINSASLVIGGDFNFPGWDWKTKSIKAGAAYTGLHHRFSDIIDNIGLVQIVEEPTGKDNFLDLILTN